MHCLVAVAAFFFCTALATKFISPAHRCGRDPRRCLLLSSNPPQFRGEQESAETREINTWYPIPWQKVLFDTRKNSEAGFASNFNKLNPRGADGYPHANDFQRSERLLEKGEAVEEFGIRFWSLTDGENKGSAANRMAGMERSVKWNDTAGGGAISFALNNTENKSNAGLGLADTYRVNNTFLKTNKLETSLTTEKPIEESEEFQNIRAMDGGKDSASSDEFLREYLNTENKQENPNDSLFVPVFPGIFQKSLPIKIFNHANLETYSPFVNLGEEEDMDERNHNSEFPKQNIEENNNNINKGIESTRIDYTELNFQNTSFDNFNTDKKVNTDGLLYGYDKMRSINISSTETNTFKPQLKHKMNKSDTIYPPIDSLEIENDVNKTNYIKVELDRNDQTKLNLSEYRSIGSLGPFKISRINGSQFPEVIATIRLEINDAELNRQNREAGDSSLILYQSTKLFQNKPNQDKNSQNSASLPVICDSTTCLGEKSHLNIKDSDSQFHKMLSKKQMPASFKRRRSTDALKTSQVRHISDFYSNKISERNKRSARGTDSRETLKLHQSEGTGLKKEDFRVFSVSDNVSVATESWKSYQTGTLARDKVTTPPSLSNEVSPKNDSVPRFDEEGRKKFELQIDEEDSLDKDLGALKMETGIGDQLRNDIKERQPNGGQYIYIRLRSLHSLLKELGKSGRHRIRVKERARYPRMPLRKARNMHSNKFSSSQRTLLRDRYLKYGDYIHSKNGTLSVNHTANTVYFGKDLNISEKANSNNNGSEQAKDTLTLPKLTHLVLNQNKETNSHTNYKFLHNRTDKSVNKSRSPILSHYLERKHESKKDEKTTKHTNRDEDLWNLSSRRIVDKNFEFNSSHNGSHFSSPYRNLNFIKVLNVSRIKRQLKSVIFDHSEQTNVFVHKKIHPSLNAQRNGKNLLNNKKYPLSIHKPNTGSNVYIIDKSPNPIELSVFQFPYSSDYKQLLNHDTKNKYRSRSRKIRDLLRNADLLNRWRILGRSATPGRNLTFLSYPQNLASSEKEVSRPTVGLRNWIRTNIYKDSQPTRISRNPQNSPEIQRKDPEIVLYFVLSPNEQRVIESSPEVERSALFPNTKVIKSQRESEDENEDTLSGGNTDISSADQDSVISRDVNTMQFGTGIRNKRKPNIGEQYARYVNDESSENATQITDDWLNSQWIYINGLGSDQSDDNEETLTTTEVPYLTISPRTPKLLGKTTPEPITTTNNPNSTSTEPTEETWGDIQNIPSSHKHWEDPNEQWEINSPWKTNYNQWNIAKRPWNLPDGRWEMPRRPWYPENDPWKREKNPWNQDSWKATKQPWTPPVDPWEKGKKTWDNKTNAWEKEKKPWNPPNDPWKPPVDTWKPPVDPWKPPVDTWKPPVDPWKPPVDPWKPPVDPWKPPVNPWEPPIDPWEENKTSPEAFDNSEKIKRPWNSKGNAWENEKIPWISSNNPWKTEKGPWNPPIHLWKMKNSHWNSPDNVWKKDKKPWNHPDNLWEKDRKPWNAPEDAIKITKVPWEKDKRPWSPPIDPWEKEKVTWKLPVDPWKKENRPWNPPLNQWKMNRTPWNPPLNRWKMNKTPLNPPSNPWNMMKWQWRAPTDPWKISLSWWDCKR